MSKSRHVSRGTNIKVAQGPIPKVEKTSELL